MPNFRAWLSEAKKIIESEKKDRIAMYEVVSYIENYKDSGELYVHLRSKGTRNTFYKPIRAIYKQEWLKDFSPEDAAYLAVLFSAEQSNNYMLIKTFPRRKHTITKSVIVLAMLFVSFLILSNVTAAKLTEFDLRQFAWFKNCPNLDLHYPAALVFFPLTYFFDDTLTEVYGFKVSRLVIWGGMLCNVLVSLGIILTVHLPASSTWGAQAAYETVLGSTPRVFLGSILGYFFGEFCNAIILARMKVLTSGKWLALRVMTSSAVGIGVDSVLFTFIAFGSVLPHDILIRMVVTLYLFKFAYEILALPLTYLITGALKRLDRVDYYDYTTCLNPFSLKLDDD